MKPLAKKRAGVVSKYEINMTEGPLLGKILIFSLPLMLSSMLQLLFNAADMIVVGRFVGKSALAAVGSTTALITLLTNLFIGFSVGTNVLVAQALGSGDDRAASDSVHTSILFSVICGIFLAAAGYFVSPPLLEMMGTQEEVIDQASLYMRIYFAGMPVMMLYNFAYAIMRALGDTRRPMYFLTFSGIINVILNVFFVTQLHMGVEGVAIPTVISQAISAALTLRCLARQENSCRLEIKKLRIVPRTLGKIVKIGIPAGMQGIVFSISNVLIQSSVNLFGSTTMAGNTAAQSIESFVYVAMNAMHQTALSFTGRNYGANKPDRIMRIFWICIAMVTVIGLVLGNAVYLAGNILVPIYNDDPAAIACGVLRLRYICTGYCLCGIMDTIVGSTRGMGRSFVPMVISLVGACGLRILWIYTIFAVDQKLEILYISYPISWLVTALAQAVCFAIVFRREYGRKKVLERF